MRQHVLETCNLNAASTLKLALRDYNENAPPPILVTYRERK